MKEYRESDPPEETENECAHCGNPCKGTYCSKNCKNYDLE